MMSSLAGVQEAGGKLDNRIDEIHGVWDYNAGALRRLDGKLLNSTGRAFWTLKQLSFRGRRAFVSRSGGDLNIRDDSQPLSGIMFPYPAYPDRHRGYGFPADWPEDPLIEQSNEITEPQIPGGSSPSGPTGDVDDSDDVLMALTPSPDMVEFDTAVDSSGASRTLRVKKSDATNGEGDAVKVVWNEGVEWMSIRYLGPSLEQTVSNGDLVPLGPWISQDAHDLVFRIRAYPNELDGTSGTYTKTLTFSVVEWNEEYPGGGTASCVAAAKLVAHPPEIDMITSDPSWDAIVDDAI